jgi:hypothetical protein
MLNLWNHVTDGVLPANGRDGVVINLLASDAPGMKVRARVSLPAVLAGAHRLRIIESPNVGEPTEIQAGVHRDRSSPNGLPAWLLLKLGMVETDQQVIHPPGSFAVPPAGPGGLVIASAVGNATAPADLGEFFLSWGVQYLIEVENLEGGALPFSLVLDYQFAKPSSD